MRIAVVGVGAVGGYFGARLALSGEDVVFVARGETLAALRRDGLAVESILGHVALPEVVALDNPATAAPADIVLLGVKAWQVGQVGQVAPSLAPALAEDGFVLPLQNGVDAPRELTKALGERHVVGGLCTILAQRVGPARIRHFGAVPSVVFGELDGRRSGRLEALRETFGRAGVDAHISDDIEAAMWRKFMLITTFAGVGAAARQPIGVLRGAPESRNLLERCAAEIGDVARARGIAVGDDAEAATMRVLDGFEPHGTASMQRDIAEGRPSELDYLTGAVVRMGEEAGVETPAHEVLYGVLRPSEAKARGALA